MRVSLPLLALFIPFSLLAASPTTAPGWSVRELVALPENPTRIADDGSGKCLFVLCFSGDVYRVELPGGSFKKVLDAQAYAPGQTMAVGLALDAQRRMYLVTNLHDTSPAIQLNRVTIYRSDPVRDGEPIAAKPWLRTEYPWGVNVFNHGVGHLAFGPDGMLYVASGSRTDSNEPGNDPHISKEGETPITSCIWRLDPRSEAPKIEVFADGLRNPYGFCWDDRGQMWATDNGPNEDPPEELNRIERGKHYGFPYQFSDWSKSPYPHTPKTPQGMKLELPVMNVGPDGGGSTTRPLSTFDPHSSPTGIAYLGNGFPESCRGSFVIPRFGPLLDKPEVGFDLLLVKVHAQQRADGRIEADVHRLLYPVARPVDVHLANGKVYLCEFSREAIHLNAPMNLPGRILELTPETTTH